MNTVASFIVISGDTKITKFMQVGDVWENGKVNGEGYTYVVTFDGERSLQDCGLGVQAIKGALEESGHVVSFIHLESIECDNVTIRNIKGEVLPYVNSEVRTISDGSRWELLSNIIEKFGFKVETTGQVFIEKIEAV